MRCLVKPRRFLSTPIGLAKVLDHHRQPHLHSDRSIYPDPSNNLEVVICCPAILLSSFVCFLFSFTIRSDDHPHNPKASTPTNTFPSRVATHSLYSDYSPTALRLTAPSQPYVTAHRPLRNSLRAPRTTSSKTVELQPHQTTHHTHIHHGRIRKSSDLRYYV